MRSLANAAGREAGVYIGLMSGTSADGVDAAAVVLTDGAPPRELGFHTFPYPSRLRDRVLRAVDGEAPPSEVNELHMLVGEAFGMATQMLLEAGGAPPAGIVAVGSHGQTVWHRPPTERSPRGATLQLGSPAVIAARAGVPVVSDFRSADVAQGGQGAPLVPYVDWMLFAHPTASRALQNIGGIANVTFLAAGCDPGSVVAFDTGPGNALIDVAVAELTRGAATMDVDGAMAARGTPDEGLLTRWMAEPYFRRTPPKSTGRELFGKAYALRLVDEAR
ncbi:anhydro-N-acetylmuramic acid kinase, partial [Candidatus Poribacteria bacterium]|nr:anhydro-N-acetylmuramic acid kinase [Candidatus Poribacteria bacterium]